MSAVRYRVRRGAYFDSLVLMRLQVALGKLPGVEAAGAVLATPANREILAAGGLLPDPGRLPEAAPEDLVVAVRAESGEAAEAALAEVDALLARRGTEGAAEHRPRSLATAFAALPEARWTLVSVPGRWAPRVAREALEAGRHVFLFSDNVAIDEEVALKREAARRGLLVTGPDCGTAWIGGVGLGFANRVRRGEVGLVAASGTGLQAVACRLHRLGLGVSHGIGTGGRDLSHEVGAATALAGLDLLARDPATRVVVLVAKPPAPAVARRLLGAARDIGKPVVVRFLGERREGSDGNLTFAPTLAAAADAAAALAGRGGEAGVSASGGPAAPDGAAPASTGGAGASTPGGSSAPDEAGPAVPSEATEGSRRPRFLRGLFAGGTLAAEAALLLAPRLGVLGVNFEAPGTRRLEAPGELDGHALLDLGDDELTRGRLHPMLDPTLRDERLAREAADPSVAALLADVVLGDGTHPDPTASLAPAIERALAAAREAGRRLDVAAVVVGTDEDPQDLGRQSAALRAAGAAVFETLEGAVEHLLERLGASGLAEEAGTGTARSEAEGAVGEAAGPDGSAEPSVPVDLADLGSPLAAVNVGLEVFHESLLAQGARSVQVDWRPPAGGDERLAALLAKIG